MPIILITGMSGAGKSTALTHLAQHGHHTVDTDYGDWLDHSGPEPLWHPDRINALLSHHEHTGDPLYIAGTVLNQSDFYPRFDHIALLTAPIDVLIHRVATRTTNPFGRTPADRARIAADTAEVEPLLRRDATVVIDTTAPAAEVAARLLDLLLT